MKCKKVYFVYFRYFPIDDIQKNYKDHVIVSGSFNKNEAKSFLDKYVKYTIGESYKFKYICDFGVIDLIEVDQ